MKLNLITKILFQIFLILINTTSLSAIVDNKGKHFVFSFIPNYSAETLKLYISSENNTTGIVQIPSMNFSTSFTVTKNEIQTIVLPSAIQNLPNNQVSNYGIEVLSEDDIVVYALNRMQYTTDAALVLPTNSLGLEYIITTYKSLLQAEASITALYSDTQVTIQKVNSAPFDINLGYLNTYLLSGSDLTGTLITSTKPISISNGNKCTNIPSGVYYCDHIFEINPPVSTWGKSFFSVPLAMRKNGDIFRVVASQNNTEIIINNVLVKTIQKSEFYESIIAEATSIQSNKPIQVSQYSVGQNYDGIVSDPFMMLVPPHEQYMNSYTFNTLGLELNIANNFINIVIKTEGLSTLLLDGELVDLSLFKSINSSGYSGAKIPVSAGSHYIKSSEPFGLFVYGFGNYESYGYPGGMSFEKINPIGDKFFPNMSFQYIGQSILVTATDNEDINANGILESSEDLNANGILDKRSEDVNLNGILDDGEDDNNDTILDIDSGIFAIELANSKNLQLNLEGFIPGQESITFEVNVINSNLLGEGELIISDAVGNKTTRSIRILSKFNNVLVKSIVSHDRVEIDLTSFSIEPIKIIHDVDQSIIEWEFKSFEANESKEIDFDIILKNPQPGENRLVTYTTFISYTDMSGEDINISLGKQYVKVIAPDANIHIFTNKSTYSANEDVLMTSTILNHSSIKYDLKLLLTLLDENSNVVYQFKESDLISLNSSESINLAELWNTKVSMSGIYYLKGVILDKYENILDEDKTSFTIISNSNTTNLASLNLETDKKVYHTTDSLYLDSLVNNLSLNSIVRNATLKLEAKHNITNETLFTTDINIDEMPPSSLKNIPNTISLISAQEGVYTLSGRVLAEDGSILVVNSITFEVVSNINKALLAEVTALHPILEQGDLQSCSDEFFNNSATSFENQQVRQLLIRMDTEESITYTDLSLSLDINSSIVYNREIDTTPLEPGEYTCLIQAKNDTEWKTLAYDNFTLNEPPIKVEYSMSIGDRGRVLILLDGENKQWCNKNDDNDPYGPKDTPKLSLQREALETLLQTNSYFYTIVTDETSFTNEFRSGLYNSYALLSEAIKLSTQLQEELREATYRGEGLLVAGNHDNRNSKLNTILGIEHNGKHRDPISVDANATDYNISTVSLPLIYNDAIKIKLDGAKPLAYFKSSDDSNNNMLNIPGMFNNYCSTETDDKINAITYNKYSLGNSVFIGFDSLLYITGTDNNSSSYGKLFIELLNLVQPDIFTATTSNVLPVTIRLDNLGVSTSGYSISQTFNSIVSIVESGKAQVKEDGSLYWDFNLEEQQSINLDFILGMPNMDGSLTLETELWLGLANNIKHYNTYSDTIMIEALPKLEDVKSLISQHSTFLMKSAYICVKKAIKEFENQRYDKALRYAIKTSNILIRDNSQESKDIRLMLSRAIKALSTNVKIQDNKNIRIFKNEK